MVLFQTFERWLEDEIKEQSDQDLHCLLPTHILLTKKASENVICLSHLLHIFANIIDKFKSNSVGPDQTALTGAD